MAKVISGEVEPAEDGEEDEEEEEEKLKQQKQHLYLHMALLWKFKNMFGITINSWFATLTNKAKNCLSSFFLFLIFFLSFFFLFKTQNLALKKRY